MSTAKQEMLERIRGALQDVRGDRAENYAAIKRGYIESTEDSLEERLNLFTDRLHDYDATVYRGRIADIAHMVEEALTVRKKLRVVVSNGLPPEWLPQNFAFIANDGLNYDEIDRSDGVITGCALAVAFTGTIVLCHSSSEGRRALTLIPDYHLCIVLAKQVVQTVPEAIRRMSAFAASPITTIAGPSATADIEMTRIKGVHGPRTLDVILALD